MQVYKKITIVLLILLVYFTSTKGELIFINQLQDIPIQSFKNETNFYRIDGLARGGFQFYNNKTLGNLTRIRIQFDKVKKYVLDYNSQLGAVRAFIRQIPQQNFDIQSLKIINPLSGQPIDKNQFDPDDIIVGNLTLTQAFEMFDNLGNDNQKP